MPPTTNPFSHTPLFTPTTTHLPPTPTPTFLLPRFDFPKSYVNVFRRTVCTRELRGPDGALLLTRCKRHHRICIGEPCDLCEGTARPAKKKYKKAAMVVLEDEEEEEFDDVIDDDASDGGGDGLAAMVTGGGKSAVAGEHAAAAAGGGGVGSGGGGGGGLTFAVLRRETHASPLGPVAGAGPVGLSLKVNVPNVVTAPKGGGTAEVGVQTAPLCTRCRDCDCQAGRT